MKVLGRYGFFTPRPDQAPFYAKREKRRQQQQREAAQAQAEWLKKHQACANGCGKPVAFLRHRALHAEVLGLLLR